MLFPYLGKKSGPVLQRILEELAKRPNAEYREPFFGSGAVGLNVPFENVWFNDKDQSLAYLWDTIIHDGAWLAEQIASYQPSRERFWKAQSGLSYLHRYGCSPDSVRVTGFMRLVMQKLAFRSVCRPTAGYQPNRRIGGTSRWNREKMLTDLESIRGKFAKFRLACNLVTHLDFEAVLRAPGKATAYLDPPYYDCDTQYYMHSFAPADHQRLAHILKYSPHDWVLSYGDHPRIRELYSWAKIEEIPHTYKVQKSDPKIELLITRP